MAWLGPALCRSIHSLDHNVGRDALNLESFSACVYKGSLWHSLFLWEPPLKSGGIVPSHPLLIEVLQVAEIGTSGMQSTGVLGQSPPALLKQVPTWVNKGGAKRKPTGMRAVDPNIHLKATAVIFLSFFSLLRSGGEQVASKLSRCFSRETFQGRGNESEGLLKEGFKVDSSLPESLLVPGNVQLSLVGPSLASKTAPQWAVA